MSGDRLTCPYCYEQIGAQQTTFRCEGTVPPTFERKMFGSGVKAPKGVESDPAGRPIQCMPAVDPIRKDRSHKHSAIATVFAVSGDKLRAGCPKCLVNSTLRICPHCHDDLPVGLNADSSNLVAMIGAKESGKTVFTTVLVHEFRSGLGERLGGASLMAWDETTRTRFAQELEPRIYRDHLMPGATQAAATSDFKPLVYKLSPRPPVRRLEVQRPEAILSLFDAAGEDLTSTESIRLHTRYLQNSSGIVLLIDPLQLVGARMMARPGIKLPELENVDTPQNVLSRVIEMLQKSDRHRPGRLIDTPIAVGLSKIDAFDLPLGSALSRNEPTGVGFDVADSNDVHEQVRSLLHQWGADDIDHALAAHFKHFRFFGFSALGSSPTQAAPNVVVDGQVHPYRVADPVIWLLDRFGLVPKRAGR